MSKDKEESGNIPPAEDLNKENAENKRIADDDVKSGDSSATSPAAKDEIKDDKNIGDPSKDDKNVEGLRSYKSDDTFSGGTSPGAKNEMKVGEHSAKPGEGPSAVNAPQSVSEDETVSVDVVGIDEDENNGLTAAEALIAQMDEEERRRNDQSSDSSSSSSSNEIDSSCDENPLSPPAD